MDDGRVPLAYSFPSPVPRSSSAPPMNPPAPNPELLRSLGRLVHGLAALFWGLPVALLVCVYTVRADWLPPYGFLPPILAGAWLLYGLGQMGHFQKQERVWMEALDRARLLGLTIVGLCPFLYGWNKMPGEPHFAVSVGLLAAVGLLFLATLNLVLRRLSAMLPDETLRLETSHFTAVNRGLLFVTLGLLAAYFGLNQVRNPPPNLVLLLSLGEQLWLWLGIVFILLPLAMTMALLWKTKEVIFDSVFNRTEGGSG
jgi:hypothetical protein